MEAHGVLPPRSATRLRASGYRRLSWKPCDDLALLDIPLVWRPFNNAGRWEEPATHHGIRLSPCGQFVTGLVQWLRTLSGQDAALFVRLWTLCDSFATISSLDRDKPSLLHLLLFSAQGERQKQIKPPWARERAAHLLQSLSTGLISVLGRHMDRYLLEYYAPNHNTDKSSPSLRTRNRTRVDPGVVYDLLDESMRCGVSLSTMMRTRRHDDSCGASPSNAAAWLTKAHALYTERRQEIFRGVRHVSMVCDPSTHCKEEVMLSVLFSSEKRRSCVWRHPVHSAMLAAPQTRLAS